MSIKQTEIMNDPVVGFVVAGVAVVVWMALSDFPGLYESFLWVTGDDSLVTSQPAWKYIATAFVGFLMAWLLVRMVTDIVRGK